MGSVQRAVPQVGVGHGMLRSRSRAALGWAPSASGRRAIDLLVDLALDRGHGQQLEDALAVADDVDPLVAFAQEHAGPVDDDVGRRDVGVHLVAEVVEHLPHRLEADAGVEQLLDDLQLEQVAVGVAPAAAAAAGVGQRRPDEVGTGPVVELAVRDADDLGRPGAAEAVRLVVHRAPPALGLPWPQPCPVTAT